MAALLKSVRGVDITTWVEAYRLMAQTLNYPLDEEKLSAFKMQLEVLNSLDRTDLILKLKSRVPAYRSALNEIIERITQEKNCDPEC